MSRTFDNLLSKTIKNVCSQCGRQFQFTLRYADDTPYFVIKEAIMERQICTRCRKGVWVKVKVGNSTKEILT
jgi:thymidine kinase